MGSIMRSFLRIIESIFPCPPKKTCLIIQAYGKLDLCLRSYFDKGHSFPARDILCYNYNNQNLRTPYLCKNVKL